MHTIVHGVTLFVATFVTTLIASFVLWDRQRLSFRLIDGALMSLVNAVLFVLTHYLAKGFTS